MFKNQLEAESHQEQFSAAGEPPPIDKIDEGPDEYAIEPPPPAVEQPEPEQPEPEQPEPEQPEPEQPELDQSEESESSSNEE